MYDFTLSTLKSIFLQLKSIPSSKSKEDLTDWPIPPFQLSFGCLLHLSPSDTYEGQGASFHLTVLELEQWLWGLLLCPAQTFGWVRRWGSNQCGRGKATGVWWVENKETGKHSKCTLQRAILQETIIQPQLSIVLRLKSIAVKSYSKVWKVLGGHPDWAIKRQMSLGKELF